ncbi:MAG: BACON domain-containing protein [Bacteroidales bacterium]|nr:BACON domain-containing protein [Bacteroidales bacterium]
MKIRSFLFAAAAAVMALAGCTKGNEFGDPKVDLSTTTINVPAEGCSETVSFVATRDWQVTNIPDWIQVLPTSGNPSLEEQKITINVEPTLDARSATINIVAEEITATITVNQSRVEPSIKISGAESPVAVSAEASEVKVYVEASRDWEISGLPDWISADPANGKGANVQEVTLSVAANDGEARSATITFACMDQEVELTLDQEAAPKKIVLAGTEWRMDYGFIDPDMKGYFVGLRFTDESHVIFAEGDPEDGFWANYPMGTGTYTLKEDGTFSLDLFDDEGGEEIFDGFIQGDLLFLNMYYEAYYSQYGDACAFVLYNPA